MLRSAKTALCLGLAMLLGLSSCESAAKHPAITIGAVAGTIGFGTCELSVEDYSGYVQQEELWGVYKGEEIK